MSPNLISLGLHADRHNEGAAVIVTWVLGFFPFGLGFDRASLVITQWTKPIEHVFQLFTSRKNLLFSSIETSFISCFPSRSTLFPLKPPSSLSLSPFPFLSKLTILSSVFRIFLFPSRSVRANHFNLLRLITPPTTKRTIEHCDVK